MTPHVLMLRMIERVSHSFHFVTALLGHCFVDDRHTTSTSANMLIEAVAVHRLQRPLPAQEAVDGRPASTIQSIVGYVHDVLHSLAIELEASENGLGVKELRPVERFSAVIEQFTQGK